MFTQVAAVNVDLLKVLKKVKTYYLKWWLNGGYPSNFVF